MLEDFETDAMDGNEQDNDDGLEDVIQKQEIVAAGEEVFDEYIIHQGPTRRR